MTSQLCGQLIDEVNAYGETRFRNEYGGCLEKILGSQEILLEGSEPNFSIVKQRQAAKKLLDIPTTILFRQLGDESFGFGGSLHPMNFLYSSIDIKPISLAAFNGAILPSSNSTSNVTFGYNLSGSSSMPSKKSVDGIINYVIEADDPTSPTDILSQIEAQVDTLYQNLAVNGPLFTNILSIQNSLQQLSLLLTDCSTIVGSPTDLTAINTTLGEVKRALNIQ